MSVLLFVARICSSSSYWNRSKSWHTGYCCTDVSRLFCLWLSASLLVRLLTRVSLSQQVMTLLAGGKERHPQAPQTTSNPRGTAGVLHQGPPYGSVHLVTPVRQEGKQRKGQSSLAGSVCSWVPLLGKFVFFSCFSFGSKTKNDMKKRII